MTQGDALDILKLGHNIYLTGQPGSGKTFLLNKYISYLKENRTKMGSGALFSSKGKIQSAALPAKINKILENLKK